jgi:hypothetical protein
MTHPFFDSGTYPWHLPEAVSLYEQLYRLIQRPDEIDRIYKTCAEGLPPLALSEPPNIIWKEALENLAPWPSALRNLCNQAFTYPSLQSAIQKVKDAKAEPLLQEQVEALKNKQTLDDLARRPDRRPPATGLNLEFMQISLSLFSHRDKDSSSSREIVTLPPRRQVIGIEHEIKSAQSSLQHTNMVVLVGGEKPRCDKSGRQRANELLKENPYDASHLFYEEIQQLIEAMLGTEPP